MADEIMLIDTGATENFINQETSQKLKLRTKKLETLVGLWNINGTFNKSRQITHYLNLFVSYKTKKNTKCFYITNLGTDQLILSYPWFYAFNHNIDWPNCKLIGLAVKIETSLYECYLRL